jgi:uncharacterized protein (TIGR03437 family)
MRFALAILFTTSLILPLAHAQITLNPTPTRVIGQTSLQVTNQNPNLVEGREFFNPVGIALDRSTNPPGLYISDTGNNRVLGFRSAVAFSNGQKADLVLGQADLVTTNPQGPGRARTSGLSSPTGVVADIAGNVYVVDSGNNRILRFPKPFAQTGDQIPDFVIGQQSFTTSGANQGGISASTLALTGQNSVFVAYITFDPTGNLWIADTANNRVLRYNAAVLAPNAPPGPAADVVLGQQDFITSTIPAGTTSTTLASILTPTGIVFDDAGRLFVSESAGGQRTRILVWTPPFRIGQFATRMIGVDTDTPAPPSVSDRQLNASTGDLFLVGNQVGIADSLNNRLLLYSPYDQWTSNNLNQNAVTVIGQNDFTSGAANQAQPVPGPATLSRVAAAAFSGTELYVVDTANQRVIVLPVVVQGKSGSGFGPATRVLGQDAFDLNAPNLIEGREFNFTSGGDAGIAVDLISNSPRLYVADTYNNRILGFKDLRNIQPGAKADIVIGQPDFRHALTNYPSNDPNRPNQSSLSTPTGLYVDSDGSLYVADTGNGRVLRFPSPFDNYKPGALQNADLVLGQVNFFTKISDATARTMAAPYGVAKASGNGLLVSDVAHSRVLFFPGTSKTFTSGQSATVVFGQTNFTSAGAGSGDSQLSAPHHIATDSDDRLYVADSGNGRVAIFDHAPTATNGAHAAILLSTGLSSPRGMHVNQLTGDIWVADANANAAYRYPQFNVLAASPNYAPNATLSAFSPRALAEDAWGNIFIADSANRVVIHYPGLSTLNAANYLYGNQLAPGMIGAMYSTGNFHQFGSVAQSAPAYKFPLPRELNGLQVLFNGAPVPLFFAGTDQINFQVPISAPQSGTANIQVIETATGRLLGDSTVALLDAAPGIFTQAANGSGAAIAVNQDNTLNTQTNPAVAGDVITLYGTGQGFVDGAPPDGDVSNRALPSSRPPTVVISPSAKQPLITGQDVLYAGIAPGLVGVWQVNARIPSDVITLATNPTQVIILQNSHPSGGGGLGRSVLIYVRQPK